MKFYIVIRHPEKGVIGRLSVDGVMQVFLEAFILCLGEENLKFEIEKGEEKTDN